jgi:hypothetical protein
VRNDCTGGTFVPSGNYHGDEVFTYTVTDGAAKPPKPASVNVTIQAVNDAPVPGPDVVTTTQGVPVTIAVLSNDVDPDGDTLSVTSVGPPGAGSVTLNADGTLTYLPWADVTGSDRFVYTISDPTGSATAGSVAVTVVPPPPPAAPSIQTLRFRPPDPRHAGGEDRLQKWEASPTQR